MSRTAISKDIIWGHWFKILRNRVEDLNLTWDDLELSSKELVLKLYPNAIHKRRRRREINKSDIMDSESCEYLGSGKNQQEAWEDVIRNIFVRD